MKKVVLLVLAFVPGAVFGAAESARAVLERINKTAEVVNDSYVPASERIPKMTQLDRDIALLHRILQHQSHDLPASEAAEFEQKHDNWAENRKELNELLADDGELERKIRSKARKETVLWILGGVIVGGAVYKLIKWAGWFEKKEDKPKNSDASVSPVVESSKA